MTLKRFSTILATILSLTAVSAQNFNRTDINTEDLPTHDPVIMECDGTWYMFTTGFLVDIMTSKDLLTVRCLCHENDHLDGILYIDHLDPA